MVATVQPLLRKIIATGCCAWVATLLFSGCSTVQWVNLEKERQKYANQDLALIRPSSTQHPKNPLTLEEAISNGLKNNLELKLVRFEEMLTSDEAIAEQLKMLPNANLKYDRTHLSKPRVVNSLNYLTNAIQLNNSVSETDPRKVKSMTLSWNLLDFGLSYVRSQKLFFETEAKKMRRLRQEQQLAIDITAAYWRARLAEKALNHHLTIKKKLEKHQLDLRLAKKEKRLDPITGNELESYMLNIAIDIQNLRMEVSDAKSELARLLGIYPSEILFSKAEAPISKTLLKLTVPKQFNVEKLENYAVLHRPELFEADLKKEVRVATSREALIRAFPNIGHTFTRIRDYNKLLVFNQWSEVGFNIGWNLLSVPSNFFHALSTRHGIQLAEAERLATTMAILVQTHITLIQYEMQYERFLLYQKKAKVDTKLFHVLAEKNKLGEASTIELTRRALEGLRSELKSDQSAIDLILAHKRVLATIGLPPTLWGIKANQKLLQEKLAHD